jgi:ParB-like chromosome segregation protein Spo0J
MASLIDNIERVPIDLPKEYPGNPRKGNVQAIADSLRENGQFQPIIIQRSTGYILAGNHTWKAARGLGWDSIDAVYVDVNETEAKKIILAANKTSDLGSYDNAELAKLLKSLDGDLAGAVWTPGEADALLAMFAEPEISAPAASEFAPEPFEPVIMDHVPRTNATYAETPEQEQARAERQAAQTPRPYAGLTEVMLLYTEQQKQEVSSLLTSLRGVYGHDVRSPQLVLHALRTLEYMATEASPTLPEMRKRAGIQ